MTTPHAKKKKILVVEDDTLFAEIYASKFSEEGFDVLISPDGEDGLKKVHGERPDVVLLDLVLPKITGFEFLEAVRHDPDEAVRSMPVIVVTNLNQESYIRRMQGLGVNGYFLKSNVLFSAVLEKVRSIVGK